MIVQRVSHAVIVERFRSGNLSLQLDRPTGNIGINPRLFRRVRMTVAFVFPGQGSQSVGMGKALADNFPSAREVFAEVDEALGEKLTAIMWEGPADRLTLTENAQPALMAVSLAAMRVLEGEAGLDLVARCRVRGRSFARGIFGACGGRRADHFRYRATACAFAAARCRPRCRSGPARWRRCSDWNSTRRRRSQPRRRKDRCVRPRTTMAAARSSCPATRQRSSARSKSRRAKARGARCCCRCPLPSIAR